jgi:hypothetical protein
MLRSAPQGYAVGQVTTGWQPGENGHQGDLDVAGQVLGVTHRMEAAW